MPPHGDPLYFGQVYGSYIKNLPVGQYARIDFVYIGRCVAPMGSIINVPGMAANNVHIRNDGAALIQYSVNGANINEMIGGILAPTISRELKWPDTIVKSVNIFCLPLNDALFSSTSVEIMM
jgi:hypothetical protein